jgi:hypothetical protein
VLIEATLKGCGMTETVLIMTVGAVVSAWALYSSVLPGHSTYTVAVLTIVVTAAFGSAIAKSERRMAIKAIPEALRMFLDVLKIYFV